VTPTEYFLLAAVALIVAGFVAVLVWNLWLTPAEHERIKAAASKS
jgi:Flp pilus assembly protein CpaB